jgi:hypothetical protein
MIDSIKQIVEQIQRLQQQAYIVYEPEVERILAHQITDNDTIQRLLDGLLDFCGDKQILLLYKKLCRYYWDINPQATADYISYYRERWDNEKND